MPNSLALNVPVLGICGLSGAGKTTLLEQLVPRLRQQGLRVAVMKHDVHGIQLDSRGKDSDRLYRAGADVLLQGPDESLVRLHQPSAEDLSLAMSALVYRYDVLLIEGHKKSPWPKLWLLSDAETDPPAGVNNVILTLTRDEDRVLHALDFFADWFAEQWLRPPVSACVLIGGKSRRMGQAKHLLRHQGISWLEHIVEQLAPITDHRVVVGDGDLPGGLQDVYRLPDCPDAVGPMAGLLAAMRWLPSHSWLVVACDMPNVTIAAFNWLLAQRRPGCWGILPSLQGDNRVEPLLAYYDARARQLLEQLSAQGQFSPSCLAGHPHILTPMPPAKLQSAWSNINTPAELDRIQNQI